jgi:hypothetical protein
MARGGVMGCGDLAGPRGASLTGSALLVGSLSTAHGQRGAASIAFLAPEGNAVIQIPTGWRRSLWCGHGEARESPHRRRRSKRHETPDPGQGSPEHRSGSCPPAIRAAASYRVAVVAGPSVAMIPARHPRTSFS